MYAEGRFVVERVAPGWSDKRIEGKAEIYAGPFWNDKKALDALAEVAVEFPEKSFYVETLFLSVMKVDKLRLVA